MKIKLKKPSSRLKDMNPLSIVRVLDCIALILPEDTDSEHLFKNGKVGLIYLGVPSDSDLTGVLEGINGEESCELIGIFDKLEV